MKKHIRLPAAILALALCLTALSACGGGGGAASHSEAPVTEPGADVGSSQATDIPNVPETVDLVAPYHALAVVYGGYIYYLDKNTSLCRVDEQLQNYALVTECPLGDSVSTAYILGVSTAGRIYIGSSQGSCSVGLSDGSSSSIATTTFSGAENEVYIYGVSGDRMYYTKSNDAEKYLYRCPLSAAGSFDEEERVFDFPVWDIALTDTHIVIVTDEGRQRAVSVQRLDALQSSGSDVLDRGYGSWEGVNLFAVEGNMLVYNLCGDFSMMDGTKLIAYNMDTLVFNRGSGMLPRCAYNRDTDELYYFDNQLVSRPVSELADDTAYHFRDGYESSDYIQSFSGATIAGSWLFFKDGTKSCGAQYCISMDGLTFIKLD